MLLRTSESLHVYVHSSTVLARRVGSLPLRRYVEPAGEWHWETHCPTSLDFTCLNSEKRKGRALYVHVGAALTKLMALSLPSNVRTGEEARRIAAARMRDQLGLEPGDWNIVVDAGASGTGVACAIRSAILQAIQDAAAAANLALRSVRPYAVDVWNAVPEEPAAPLRTSALVVVESDAWSLLLARDGSIATANAMLHPGRLDSLERDLQRLAVINPDLEPDAIRVAAVAGAEPWLAGRPYRRVTDAASRQKRASKDFCDLVFARPRQ